MKRPNGFEKLHREKFELFVDGKGYDIRLEQGNVRRDRLWIFADGKTNCLYVDFAWDTDVITFSKVGVGQGDQGNKVKTITLNRNWFETKKVFIERFLWTELEDLIRLNVFEK